MFKNAAPRCRGTAEPTINIPPALRARVELASAEGGHDEAGSVFLASLLELCKSQGTRREVDCLRSLCSSLPRALQSPGVSEDQRLTYMRLISGLLFCPGSKNLQKQLLAALRQPAADACHDSFRSALHEQVAREADLMQRAPQEGQDELPTCIPTASAWASLLSMPAYSEAVSGCAADGLAVLAYHTERALTCIQQGRHASPALNTDIQDSVSSMYYIVLRYGSAGLCDSEAGRAALVAAADCACTALRGQALMREVASSAGVLLWTAFSCPEGSAARLATSSAAGLFFNGDELALRSQAPHTSEPVGVLEEAWRARGTTLAQELARTSEIGRYCAVRSLSATVESGVLCWPLETAAGAPWHVLLDGGVRVCLSVLRECSDSHVKYCAMAAVTSCLQRTASILQQHIASSSNEGVDPSLRDFALPIVDASLAGEVFQQVVTVMDEPMKLTVLQACTAVSVLCDILAKQTDAGDLLTAHRGQAAPTDRAFLDSVTSEVLAIPPHRKGRYSLLCALLPHLGADTLMQRRPQLVVETLTALHSETCSAASTFLRELLTDLHTRLLGADHASGLQAWRRHWVAPLVENLTEEDAQVCVRVATYMLPAVLELDPPCVPLLLRLFAPESEGQAREDAAAWGLHVPFARGGAVKPIVTLLRMARKMQHIDDLDSVVSQREGDGGVPRGLLLAAALSSDEMLRMDTLELAALHTKSTAIPGAFELEIVRAQLTWTLRGCSMASHNKWVVNMGKLVSRIRGAALGIHQRATQRSKRSKQAGSCAFAPRQAAKRGDVVGPAVSSQAPQLSHEEEEARANERMQAFLQWMTQYLADCLYPGAPHTRKHLAMRLLHTVLAVFHQDQWIAEPLADAGSAPPRKHQPKRRNHASPATPDIVRDLAVQRERAGASPLGRFRPFCATLRSAEFVQVLMAASIDSWDLLREAAVRVLRVLYQPLPGYSTGLQVCTLLEQALALLTSPRLHESDAGARLVSLVNDLYVVSQGWSITVFPSIEVHTSASETSAVGGLARRLSFLSSLVAGVEAQIAVAKACMVTACRQSFLHGRLLALRYCIEGFPFQDALDDPSQLPRVSELVERMLAALRLATKMIGPFLDGSLNVDASEVSEDVAGSEAGIDDENPEYEADSPNMDGSNLGASATLLVTGSWMTAKEVAFLAGTLTQVLPVNVASASDPKCHLLDAARARRLGELLLTALLSAKHNGATEKLHHGLHMVCRRLLQLPEADLNTLPSLWLQRMFEVLERPGQSRSDIVRRSAGLPFAILAVFLAEPTSTSKVLLPAALQRLILIATDESRDPWPRVHAFNCLRMTFECAALATDAAGFFAEGIKASILGLSSAEWEVRNGATLAYVSLTVRVLGFRNFVTYENARRAVTCHDFMQRFPTLRLFLLQQLSSAAEQLAANPASAPHAALYPLLHLLTRLKPSTGSSTALRSAQESLEPFLPVVATCASARIYRIRIAASRAYSSLVSSTNLLDQLLACVTALPEAPGHHGALNSLHGRLCMMESMLALNTRSYGAEAAAAVVTALMPHFTARLWLAHCAASRCAALSKMFIECLSALLTASPAVAAPALASARLPAQLLAVLSSIQHAHTCLPMWSLWLKEVTRFLFGRSVAESCLQTGGAQLSLRNDAAAIATALSCPVYEVRAEVLRCLVKYNEPFSLTAASVGGVPVGDVLSSVAALTKRERHHKVLRRALQLTALLQSRRERADVEGECSSEAVDASVLECNAMLGLMSGRMHPSVQRHALACVAASLRAALPACAHLLLSQNAVGFKEKDLLQCLERFVECCTEWAKPHCVEDDRTAACEALHTAGVLHLCTALPEPCDDGAKRALCTAESPAGRVLRAQLQAWNVAVTLLEDEDVVIRTLAGQAAAAVLDAPVQCPDAGSLHGTVEHGGAQCPDLVLRRSLQLLTRHLGTLQAFQSWLIDCMVPVGLPQHIEGLQNVSARRIFDREPDNRHEEPVLIAHSAAVSMLDLLRKSTAPASRAAKNGHAPPTPSCLDGILINALHRALPALDATCQTAAALQGHVMCGGVWSSHDLQVALLRGLTMLSVVATCRSDDVLSALRSVSASVRILCARAADIAPAHPLVIRAVHQCATDVSQALGHAQAQADREWGKLTGRLQNLLEGIEGGSAAAPALFLGVHAHTLDRCRDGTL